MEFNENEGSYLGGFLLSFFLGLVGLIIAIAINKSETKRGAITGFIIQLVLGVVCIACVFCFGLESKVLPYYFS